MLLRYFLLQDEIGWNCGLVEITLNDLSPWSTRILYPRCTISLKRPLNLSGKEREQCFYSLIYRSLPNIFGLKISRGFRSESLSVEGCSSETNGFLLSSYANIELTTKDIPFLFVE